MSSCRNLNYKESDILLKSSYDGRVFSSVVRSSSSYVGCITASFRNAKLDDLIAVLPENISFAYGDDLNNRLINLDCVNLTVDEFFSLVARKLGTDFTSDGDTYFLGNINTSDYGCYVDRLSGLVLKSDYKALLDSLKSADGRYFVRSDGVFVFTDKWPVIQRIRSALESLSKFTSACFQFEVWLVNDGLLRDFSLSNDMSLSYSFNWAVGSKLSYSNWQIVLDNLLSYNLDYSNYYIRRGLFGLVLEGEELTMKNGDEIPVPRKTVTDGGTVSTVGVDYISVGTQIKASIVRNEDRLCNVDLSAEISESVRFVESYPVKSQTLFETRCNLLYGDVTIVGYLTVDRKERKFLGVNNNKSNYWVLCFVAPVGR